MKPHFLTALACGLALCGCRSVTQTDTTPGPVSHAVTVEERSRDFYGGKPRTIPPDAFQPQVDYQSELRLIVNTNELQALMGAAASVLPPLSDAQKEQLDRLHGLLAAGRTYVRDFNSFVKEFGRLETSRTPEATARLQQLINQQGKSGQQVFLPLKQYLDAKFRVENPNLSRSQVIREQDRLTAAIYPRGQAVDLAALAEFVANESAAVVRQASADARTVRDAGSIYLRMRASAILAPGQPPTPVHIRNYDTLLDSDVAQDPRLSFKMSDEDRQRLAAETKVNTEFAQFIKDLQNGKSDIRQSLDALLPALRGDLKSWKEAGANLDQLNQKLQPVIVALGQASGAAQLDAAEKQVLADATATLALATNRIQEVANTIRALTGTNNPDADPASVLLNAADTLSSTLADFGDLPHTLATNLTATLSHLELLVETIRTNRPAALPAIQALADVLKAGAPSSAAAIEALMSVTLQKYPELIAELKSLTTQGQLLNAESKLPPIQTDPNLIDIAASNPPDGFISLQRNIPRGGATLMLDAALVTRKDTAAPEVKPAAHQEFDIEKFGLINTWSANLVFVKRLGNIPAGQTKAQFSPSASIAWTLHYNPPPSDKPRNKFWDTVYPGVGVNVAALSWDNGVQVGVGGHASLFHDLLTVGAGYNLQESTHGAYVFVGLGIFQALSQLGVTGANFPLGQ